jgi:hypothetical protein
MDGNYCFCLRRSSPFYFRGIQIERGWINIRKNWPRAEAHNCRGRCDERERRNDYVVTRPYAGRREGDGQRVGAIGQTDGVFGVAKCRQIALQSLSMRAEDELLGLHDSINCRANFGVELGILRPQIQKGYDRDFLGSRHSMVFSGMKPEIAAASVRQFSQK